MKKGIIGKKLAMTQIFDAKGNVIPVTLIEAGPCVVAQKKTVENDGYNAVQLAYADAKVKHVNKAQLGHFKKAGITPKRHLKEFRLEDCTALEVGSVVTVDTFAAGEKVDITGITKGHAQRDSQTWVWKRRVRQELEATWWRKRRVKRGREQSRQ